MPDTEHMSETAADLAPAVAYCCDDCRERWFPGTVSSPVVTHAGHIRELVADGWSTDGFDDCGVFVPEVICSHVAAKWAQE